MTDDKNDARNDEWSLHFHRTITVKGGTRDLDVFTVRSGFYRNHITLLTPKADRERLAQLVVERLNEVPRKAGRPVDLAVNAMFHGPWQKFETLEPRLTLTETEVTTIRRYMAKLGAENAMLEYQYDTIKVAHNKLLVAAETMQQELLVLRGRANSTEAPRDVTVADLFETAIPVHQGFDFEGKGCDHGCGD